MHSTFCRLLIVPLIILGSVILTSCVTQSANQILKPFDPRKYKTVRIDACVDRTGVELTRNLGEEASKSLREKVLESGRFFVKPDGDLMLTCDIERFAEGSVLKRWLWPGWGTTKAKITVMVSYN